MHPPISLIFFFILAGLSIGSFTVIFIFNIFFEGLERQLEINRYLSLILIALGAFSASFHLGHKLRAWKVIKGFKTSWLSREAVFSFVFGLFLLISAVLPHYYSSLAKVVDLVALISGWLGAFSTAMIYTGNRFVPEWNTSLNTFYFINMYLTMGSALSSCILFRTGNIKEAKISIFLTLIFISSGAILRVSYHIRQHFIRRATLEDALNLSQNRSIKVLDKGSTTDNYCTKEFYYEKGKKILGQIQFLAYIFAFLIPFFLYLFGYSVALNPILMPLSLIVLIIGTFAERWCFFVEGRHVQNLYYGLL